ncbi:MAG: PAS domain S-box protein [Dehalococcoidia bacterium]|nr:PAS domain S-box protein [Dehalococcoidia bacterium]
MTVQPTDFATAQPFLDSAPLPMAVVSPQGEYLYVNEAGRRFFRYTDSDLLGQHYRSFIDGAPGTSGAFDAARAGQSSWVRREIRRGDGSVVVVDAGLSPLPDGNLLLIGRDATAEAQAEQRLRASEGLLNRTESISQAGSWSWDLKTGELVWSRGAYEVMGYDPESMIPTRQLLRDSAHPDDREAAREAFERMLAGQPTTTRHRVFRGDGALRWMETIAEPEFDAEGRPFRIIGSVRDITDAVLADESLRRSQRYLAEAQRLGHVGSWEDDLVSGDAMWSDEAYRILGREPGSVPPTAESFAAHVDPDDVATWREARDRAVAGQPAFARVRIHRPDGEMRWVQVGTEPTVENGEVVHLVGYTQDITEQVAFEQSLRDQQSLLQEAARIGRTGSWIHDLEEPSVSWSDGTCRIFGFEPAEVSPRPGLAASLIHPDDADAWREAYGGMIKHGVPMSIRARIVQPGGAVRWVHARGEAIRRADGRTSRLIGSIHDVTEEAVLESALRDSALRLRQILESAPLPIILIDAEGLIEAMNPAAESVFGWTLAEMSGKPLSLLCDTDEIPGAGVHRGRRKDGVTFPLEATVASIRDEVGPGRQVVMCVDLTEREAREEQVRALQKTEALGTLVAGVAHDFNNLLTAISGSLTMLDEGVPGNWLTLADDATTRATDLVRRLLQFARGEAAEMDVVDLRTIASETVGIVRETFDRRIQLDVSYEPGLPPAYGNRTQLQQALLNLLVNARDAVMERALDTAVTFEPRIAVALSEGELDGQRAIRIAVVDNGVGVPDEVANRIFDPFFTTKSPKEGTGLGLAIVASTVRSHRGKITVEPRPGGGTAFVMLVPAAAGSQATDDAPGDEAEVESARLEGLRTLVVDDEFSLRHIALSMLEFEGAQVDVFASAEAVLAEFTPGAYDVAVVDLNMPGMNGWQLLDRLRELDPGLGIVVLSGYIDEARAETHRPDRMLPKPYQRDGLIEAILGAAERRAAFPGADGTA